jgi:hypothetical protein
MRPACDLARLLSLTTVAGDLTEFNVWRPVAAGVSPAIFSAKQIKEIFVCAERPTA